MNKTLCQTQVFPPVGGAYFVSTINRECSAVEARGMIYAETIVWEWNPETRQRGKIIYQGEDGEDCITEHQHIVDKLYAYGGIKEEE